MRIWFPLKHLKMVSAGEMSGLFKYYAVSFCYRRMGTANAQTEERKRSRVGVACVEGVRRRRLVGGLEDPIKDSLISFRLSFCSVIS